MIISVMILPEVLKLLIHITKKQLIIKTFSGWD